MPARRGRPPKSQPPVEPIPGGWENEELNVLFPEDMLEPMGKSSEAGPLDYDALGRFTTSRHTKT